MQSTFNFLAAIAINQAYPVIGRAAGRAIVGTINFKLINDAAREIRTSLNGLPVSDDEQNTIDHFNQKASDERKLETGDDDTDGMTQEELQRHEQGYDVPENWRVEAGLLVMIKDHITDNLLQYAGEVRRIIDGKLAPNPYDIAPSFELSFDQQMTLGGMNTSEVTIAAECAALGITRTDWIAAHNNSRLQQVNFLKNNKLEIFSILKNLEWMGDPLHIEDAFDRLPGMTRLRLMSAADRGLFRAREREIMNFSRASIPELRENAKGNIGLIDGTRREILDEVDNMFKHDAHFRREIDEAQKRGASIPNFNPRPGVQAESKTA